MLTGNTVYFNQKVIMKTTLEKAPGKSKYGKKDLVLKLVRAEDKSLLGSASVNLASYSQCVDRKLFSVDL